MIIPPKIAKKLCTGEVEIEISKDKQKTFKK